MLSRPAAAVVLPNSEAVPWADLAVDQWECQLTTELDVSNTLLVEMVMCGGAEVLVDWSTGVPSSFQ